MITIIPRRINHRVVQFIEVYLAILATSWEAHIIMEPVNTHDFTLVSMELEALSVLSCVKVEDVNILFLNHAGEHVTTVWELNLIATFEHIGSKRCNWVTKNVAPYNLVL